MQTSLCHAFGRTVERVPHRVALRTLRGERQVTWLEYASHVERIAAALVGMGIKRRDSVAIMSSNRIEFHLIDTAIMHVGAVTVSIYNTLRPREIPYILGNSGARTVFAERSYVEMLSRVEQIKRYRVLDREWLPGGDELSATMKLKRRQINDKYRELIDELYASN